MRKYAIDNETALLFAVSVFLFVVFLLSFHFRTVFVVPSTIVVISITIPLFYYIGSNNVVDKSVSGNALFVILYLTVSVFVVLVVSIILYALAPSISLVLFNNGGMSPGNMPVLLTEHDFSVLAGHQLLFKTILTLPAVLVLILTVDYLINMLKLARSTDIVFGITMQAISASLLLNMSAISYILYNVLLTAQPAHNSTYQYYISSVTLQQLKMMKHLGLIPHLLVIISEAYLIVTFVLIIISMLKTGTSERAE